MTNGTQKATLLLIHRAVLTILKEMEDTNISPHCKAYELTRELSSALRQLLSGDP